MRARRPATDRGSVSLWVVIVSFMTMILLTLIVAIPLMALLRYRERYLWTAR